MQPCFRSFKKKWAGFLSKLQLLTQKTYEAVWSNFSVQNQLTEEFANSYLNNLKNKITTKCKYKKIIEKGLRLFLGDKKITLSPIQGLRYKKPKYVFSDYEIICILESLRWNADLQIEKKDDWLEYFYICFTLAKYGMRSQELIKYLKVRSDKEV